MTSPFDRVPGIDHDAQLPLPVRERMAQNLSDPSTPEGAELSRTFMSVNLAAYTPVESFGVVGDGVTDNTAALTKAFASGRPLLFQYGATYVTGRILTTAKVNVVATGATFIMNDSTNNMIQRVMPLGTIYSVTSITAATELISEGGSSVQPVYNIVLDTAAPSSWKRGDKLVIGSDDPIPNVKTFGDASTERSGAFLTVISTSGVNLKVSGRIDDAMTTAIRLARMEDINGFSWDGGTFDYTDAAFKGGGYVFFLTNGFGVQLKNLVFKRVKSAAFYLRGLLNWHIDNIAVLHGVNALNTAAYGYGVANYGCQQGVLSNSYFSDLRHGYTNGGSGTVVGAGTLGYNGRPSDNLIVNCTAESTTASGFDSHTQGLRETFENCSVKNSELGIGLRGEYHTVNNCRVTNSRLAVWFFDERNGSPKGGTIDGLTLTNVDNVFEIRCNENNPAAANYLAKEAVPFVVRNVTSLGHKGRFGVVRNAIVNVRGVFATYGPNGTSNDFGSLVKNGEFYCSEFTVIAGVKFSSFAIMTFDGHPNPSTTIEIDDLRVINAVASDYVVGGSATTQRCRIAKARYNIAPTATTQYAYSTSYAVDVKYPA